MELNNTEKQLLQIERACGDLRRGMAVIITQENGDSLAAASPDNLFYINKLIGGGATYNLIISATRAAYLFPDHKISTPMSIRGSKLRDGDIAAICASSPSDSKLSYDDFKVASQLEQSALKLAKISELIPAIVTFSSLSSPRRRGSIFLSSIKLIKQLLTFKSKLSGIWIPACAGMTISIPASSIDSYMETAHYNMFEVCSTPLNLAHAPDARIIAYRPNIGGSEHYAIIIGKPGSAPLVRIHSSCYTGDLLASLDCDCRDQLHSAIELMGKNEGGIILYLMQEGRGIGLVNKLRAYDLKHKGMDTVEANRALGFDDDERLFLPAAEILKKLNISSVNLLTNNPRKAAGLEEYGIKVTKCTPHIMQSNEHNKAYLQTKVDRLGHIASS